MSPLTVLYLGMYLVRPSDIEVNTWESMLNGTSGAEAWGWDSLFAAMKKVIPLRIPCFYYKHNLTHQQRTATITSSPCSRKHSPLHRRISRQKAQSSTTSPHMALRVHSIILTRASYSTLSDSGQPRSTGSESLLRQTRTAGSGLAHSSPRALSIRRTGHGRILVLHTSIRYLHGRIWTSCRMQRRQGSSSAEIRLKD